MWAYYSAAGKSSAQSNTPIKFAVAHGTSPALPKSADPQRGTSIATPVPVRPIGRTGTEVTAIQNTRESKPRSQSQITAVPDNRSQPDILKVIVSGADADRGDTEGLIADAARLIHAFWVSQRQLGSIHDGLLAQLAGLSRTHAALPNQRLR